MIALYFFSEGQIVRHFFGSKKEAEKATKYMNHVMMAIKEDDPAWLGAFKNRSVVIEDGTRILLETNLEILKRLVNRDGSINV